MKKYALMLQQNNVVQLVVEAVNMSTTPDGYVVEIPLESTVKVGDIYNPATQEFIIVDTQIQEEV